MSIKIISYDLGQPETSSDYKKLIDYIKGLGAYKKPLESFWLVKTDYTCKTIRDNAKKYLDANDRIFVVKWSLDDWAGLRLRDNAGGWLNDL
jgi:hypothetical protein